jgi:hypothetical protein
MLRSDRQCPSSKYPATGRCSRARLPMVGCTLCCKPHTPRGPPVRSAPATTPPMSVGGTTRRLCARPRSTAGWSWSPPAAHLLSDASTPSPSSLALSRSSNGLRGSLSIHGSGDSSAQGAAQLVPQLGWRVGGSAVMPMSRRLRLISPIVPGLRRGAADSGPPRPDSANGVCSGCCSGDS